jgi:hypothetical protein
MAFLLRRRLLSSTVSPWQAASTVGQATDRLLSSSWTLSLPYTLGSAGSSTPRFHPTSLQIVHLSWATYKSIYSRRRHPYYLREQIASYLKKSRTHSFLAVFFQAVKGHGPIRSGTDLLPLVSILVYELHSISYWFLANEGHSLLLRLLLSAVLLMVSDRYRLQNVVGWVLGRVCSFRLSPWDCEPILLIALLFAYRFLYSPQ